VSWKNYKASTDSNQAEIVAALRQAGRYVMLINGVVDLLVSYQGKMFLLEIKTKKGKLRPSQEKLLKEWKGPEIHIVRTIEEALEVTGK
jgi:hypothetical protein